MCTSLTTIKKLTTSNDRMRTINLMSFCPEAIKFFMFCFVGRFRKGRVPKVKFFAKLLRKTMGACVGVCVFGYPPCKLHTHAFLSLESNFPDVGEGLEGCQIIFIPKPKRKSQHWGPYSPGQTLRRVDDDRFIRKRHVDQ